MEQKTKYVLLRMGSTLSHSGDSHKGRNVTFQYPSPILEFSFHTSPLSRKAPVNHTVWLQKGKLKEMSNVTVAFSHYLSDVQTGSRSASYLQHRQGRQLPPDSLYLEGLPLSENHRVVFFSPHSFAFWPPLCNLTHPLRDNVSGCPVCWNSLSFPFQSSLN